MKIQRHNIILRTGILLLITLSLMIADEADYKTLHEKGKQLYQNGRQHEALDIYQQILKLYPEDIDAMLFHGRLLAQLERYEPAEAELQRVIELAPEYLDAYYALASVYYWSGDLENARHVLTRWIRLDIENPEAYLLSARVSIAGRKFAAARTFLEQALDYGADPALVESLLLQINVPGTKTRWSAGVRYEYLFVDQGRSDWQQVQASLGHDFSALQITAEYNHFRRNDTSDHTIVLDSYYGLGNRTYMNTRIQVGMGGAFLPRADITLEVFQAAGTRHEPAAGYRLMYYDSTAAHIPSFAWAMYPGNWYLRDKVSLILNAGVSWQNQFTARYFFDDADNYVQIMNVLGTDFNVFNNEWVQSLSFSLSGSMALSEQVLLNAVFSWTRDEFLLNRTGALLGLSYRW